MLPRPYIAALLLLLGLPCAHAAIGTPVALTSKAFSGTSGVSQSVTLTTGDLFVLTFTFDSTRTVNAVTWNSIAMTQDALLTYGSAKTAVYSLYITTGATANYSITLSAGAQGITNPFRVTGITTTSWTDKENGTDSSSATTSPTSGATATLTQASELAIGVLGNGTSSVGGTWSNSYAELTTTVTGSSGAVDVGYLITAATTAQTAAKTGATSARYGSVVVTYKGAGGGAAKVCTMSLMGAGVC
ncbi:MAG: hypothetical protein M3O20_13500 [Acidobacteriota bacterium]|nr:hypothetical protein [Acidobacteriota bacterium]